TTAYLLHGGEMAFAQPKQRSLRPGITQTRQAIQQIDQMLLQNQNDLTRLFAASAWSFLTDVAGKDLDNGTTAVGTLGNGYTLNDLRKALDDGDYPEVIENAASLIAAYWVPAQPQFEALLGGGQIAIDVSGKLYEAKCLLSDQAQLI